MSGRCADGSPRVRRRRRARGRRLQTRLFFWFVLAIAMAFVASAASVFALRPEPGVGPTRIASRAIASHAARAWDDPPALAAYLQRLHELLGIDARVRRDVDALPPPVHRVAHHGGSVTFDAEGSIFVPVVRDGRLVGALQLEAERAPPSRVPPMIVALVAGAVVLAFAARGVSARLAMPLEIVANAATRFGGGDLGARTGLDDRRRRWVAEEVREVARAFDGMAERIERVVREQRELLGAISHELRSPLGRARVALEIARDRSGAAAEPSFDEVERQLGEVDAILGDLLAAARAGLSDLRAERADLLPWLRARIAAEAGAPPIELVARDDADVAVMLEAALMNRVVHNLVANARAHGHPPDAPLVVRVERDGDDVRVAVRDRGPGFPPELLARAFEPFVKGDAARTPRADAAASAGAGAGLGLALVRRIVEAHGGRAYARNIEAGEAVEPAEDAGGAEVGFTLPIARA